MIQLAKLIVASKSSTTQLTITEAIERTSISLASQLVTVCEW